MCCGHFFSESAREGREEEKVTRAIRRGLEVFGGVIPDFNEPDLGVDPMFQGSGNRSPAMATTAAAAASVLNTSTDSNPDDDPNNVSCLLCGARPLCREEAHFHTVNPPPPLPPTITHFLERGRNVLKLQGFARPAKGRPALSQFSGSKLFLFFAFLSREDPSHTHFFGVSFYLHFYISYQFCFQVFFRVSLASALLRRRAKTVTNTRKVLYAHYALVLV